MKRSILSLVLVFIMSIGVFSNDAPKITVTGTGRVETVPDTAVISFTVLNTGEELSPIKKENDRITKDAVEALKKYGIAREDMFTSNYNISHNYEYPVKNKERKKVYTVRNQLRVTVRDIEKVGEVVTILEKNGVNTIQGINYTTSKSEELRLEAIGRAYKDAKKKALHLAGLEGSKVEVISISANNYTPRPEVYMAADAMRSKSATPIYAPTEVSVDANITAVFKMVK